MKRRLLTPLWATLLAVTLALWAIPPVVALAEEAEYAPNRVNVMYVDGAVSTSAPTTKAGRQAQSQAQRHRSSAFGTSAESVGGDAVSKAENTLGQQVEILDVSLGDYLIEDTIVFEREQRGHDLVISTISSDALSTEELVESLQDNEKVRYVEPDYARQASSFEDWSDTYLGDMYQLTGENGIHADAVWESEDYAASSANSQTDPVVVAVVDSGIDYTHPDLANRMWVKPNSKAFSKFVGKYGCNTAYDTHDPMDDNGHGTHCAGIIAAEANNALGVVGVAGTSDKVRLLAVKVLEEDGNGYVSDILAGIRYVTELKKAGARICAMNCSYGGPSHSRIEGAAHSEAGEAGILTIAAAGNSSEDIDQAPFTPGGYESDSIITVGASNFDGSYASYSNYGNKNVDVVAPGTSILSTSSHAMYQPFLFDAGTIRGYQDEVGVEHAGTTEYYGEFDGATIERATNAQGEEVDVVRPVAGTDYRGDQINREDDPTHQVGEFGTSVMLANRTEGSGGTSSLEITTEGAVPFGGNEAHLRWNITNAKGGDVYILFFPYEKTVRNGEDSIVNLVYRLYTEKGGGSQGHINRGDVMIRGIDKDGTVDWSSMAQRDDDLLDIFVPNRSSIWRSFQTDKGLFPYAETSQCAEGEVGLGLVFEAVTDGDCYVDISSLAISTPNPELDASCKYAIMSGTSMATPVVTGAVALIASMNPELSPEGIRECLLASTNDDFDGWCSTGGMIDLSKLVIPTEETKPAISEVTADLEADTVCLEGQGFGTAPVVKVRNNTSGSDFQTISVNDISMDGGSIIISHADSSYGLIGSDICFVVENVTNGKRGKASVYVVKGLMPYGGAGEDDAGDHMAGAWSLSEDLQFVPGANDLLTYDAAGNIFLTVLDGGDYDTEQLGDDLEDAVYDYIDGVLEADEGKESPWQDASDTISGYAGEYIFGLLSEPTYMGGNVYELVQVDMGYRRSVLLLGLGLGEEPEWTVYYDSLAEFGTKPDNLQWNEVKRATLAGYQGRLYAFGIIRQEDAYTGDEEQSGYDEDDILDSVFSCRPALPVEGGVDWRLEDATLVSPRANGIALVQGGKLFYVLPTKDSGTIDYRVYQYDGSAWSVVGTLPQALVEGSRGGQTAEYDGYAIVYGSFPSVPCAVGIDDRGILFGGASFDGAGDTFRLNTSTGKIEQLPYAFWQAVSTAEARGTVADGKLWTGAIDDLHDAFEFRAIDITSGYVTLDGVASGEGTGAIYGCGHYAKGDSSEATIVAGEDSYIYSARATGTGATFELDPVSGNVEQAVRERQKPVTTTYDATNDGTIEVVFGRLSTEVDAPEKLTKKPGTYDLGIRTDGTIDEVSLTSSNSTYARVNKNGTVTFLKAGIGKKVTITASAKDDPSVSATCVVSIDKLDNTARVAAKAKTVKAANLKKAKQVVKPISVTKAQGKVSYVKASKSRSLSLDTSTGAITVKKGTKKGTYSLKVKVSVAGNKQYKKYTKTVTAKVKVA